MKMVEASFLIVLAQSHRIFRFISIEEGLSRSFSGDGGKASFTLPSAGDLRELPRVPLRGKGSCGGGGAPRDSAGSGLELAGLLVHRGTGGESEGCWGPGVRSKTHGPQEQPPENFFAPQGLPSPPHLSVPCRI